MESLQSTKSRLKAVKNVGQITKAMEVVAATKMRRAQEIALNSRAYAFEAMHLLQKLSKNSSISNTLTTDRPVEKTLFVIVASDKGLTGAFNTQVFRTTDRLINSGEFNSENLTVIAIGKKSTTYALRKHLNVNASFFEVGDYIEPEEVEPISKLIIEGFVNGKWDKVITVSTHFQTALKQETLLRQVLPVDFEKIKETIKELIPEHGRYADFKNGNDENQDEIEYIFEPTPELAVNQLLPHLIKMQIYHLILEANASEHSARRVAMKTASDNAEDLAKNLTMEYNKARQATITRELIEITSTQNAL
ncbi:MAG: F-type H+-transporting ATPase subunit gamma [Parcubacteria group bacterium Gr01-1014_20]|nr:MAG: F-type H+-transporting ATPase subunit gamma [Parcubacteria group bacterium Gr01-1014_20]